MATNVATNLPSLPGGQIPAAVGGSIDSYVLPAIVFGLSFGIVFWIYRLSYDKKRSNALNIPKIQLTFLSLFVGTVVGLLCAYLSHQDFIIDIIAGLSTTILGVQIGELLGHSSLSGKILSLERALDSTNTYARVNSILDKMDNIHGIKAAYFESSIFIEEALSDAFAKLDDQLTLIGRGEVRIESTAKELTTNKDFLLKLPSKHVYAVSYQDEKFWDDPEGIDFLKAHQIAIAAGREIHRIFVLKKAIAPNQEETIAKQIALNVKCYIVTEESIAPPYHEDFVLYDSKYVRFAQLVNESPTSQYKYATLTSDSERVRHYVAQWEYLKSKSTNADEYYKSIKIPPQN